ncbi:uncharacterized protein LOC131007890 [Salvia miltiorrhiza]|uniref:uncharacterized protein LOC131007890 n=1 Tax=Salvia miltiorrhiza TaxID=226208 RepID=UPI0025ACA2D8|nr:uncharacterized protein LOC131007890 [Salvia miltiorrhiza]
MHICCPLCRAAGEDIDHLSWDCQFARQVWSYIFAWFHVDVTSNLDVGSFIIWAMQIQASRQVTNLWRVGVMTTIWSIWNLRNRVVFDDASFSAVNLTVQIKALILEASRFSLGEMMNSVEELLVLHGLGIPGNPRRSISYVYVFWIPPPHPWHKINIDGSIHGSLPCIHTGGIVRGNGSVMGCFHFSGGRGWAFEVELFALIIALEQVVSHGWDFIWIETDCTYIVELF